jgi:hypothetical protein
VLLGWTDYLANKRSVLMTVEASDGRVEDFQALPGYFNAMWYSRVATTSGGTKWLLAGGTPGVTAVRTTDAGWSKSTVVPAPDFNHDARLTDASMVDDSLGYLTYWKSSEQWPRLVSWDGACWTDRILAETRIWALSVETGANRQPWVAWTPADSSARALYLRSPSGDVDNVLAGLDDHVPTTGFLRILPGGLDGTGAFPMVAARFEDGIRVLSRSSASEPTWVSQVLPESDINTRTGDCPFGNSSESRDDPCSGVTSCSEQRKAASTGFGLARTDAGEAFAAWVHYSSQGSYSTRNFCHGEAMTCDCVPTSTGGDGTADLVLARLTASGPRLTRFRFEMESPVLDGSREVEMAARGDTLLVAAFLDGMSAPDLTYLEIDSTALP